MTSLLGKLKEREARKAEIIEEHADTRPIPMPARSEVEDRLAEWCELLGKSVQTGRSVLDRVLRGRIVFEPLDARYEFACPTRHDKPFSGLVVPATRWRRTECPLRMYRSAPRV